jgi:hypothetical protein
LTPGIWTTDRTGRAGYSADDYTDSFSGTSSACPGAAGVAALVLSANPSLGSDEVKDALRRSCDRIDPGGGEYDEQGHSRLYGYGRLNAETAVRSVGGQTRRVHGRRVHGRRVHGRSTVPEGEHALMEAVDEDTSGDARKALNLGMYGGTGPQVTLEFLLATLLTTQAAQIQDLRERVTLLELDDR